MKHVCVCVCVCCEEGEALTSQSIVLAVDTEGLETDYNDSIPHIKRRFQHPFDCLC